MLETGSIIRRVTHEDVEFIKGFVRQNLDTTIPPMVNPDQFCKSVHGWLEQPNYAGFFTEHAVCFGCIDLDSANWSVKMGNEVCWVSDGQDGFAVLRAFEDWCIDGGATHIKLHTDIHRHSERFSKLRDYKLDKKGYRQAQTMWIRNLV